MKLVLFFITLFFASPLLACDKFEIPIELRNEDGLTPTKEKAVSYEVRAPIEYKGWKISGAAYHSGRNLLPLAMTKDYENDSNNALFFARLTKNLAEKGKVIVSYTPVPKTDKSGKIISVSPCLHTQEISFGI